MLHVQLCGFHRMENSPLTNKLSIFTTTNPHQPLVPHVVGGQSVIGVRRSLSCLVFLSNFEIMFTHYNLDIVLNCFSKFKCLLNPSCVGCVLHFQLWIWESGGILGALGAKTPLTLSPSLCFCRFWSRKETQTAPKMDSNHYNIF